MSPLFANKRILIFLLVGLFSFSVNAQVYKYTSQQLHSHNDYHQAFPFWDAYNHGFGSIEVDIFLRNNALLVGHEVKELRSEKTIEALYLEPLNQLAKAKKLDSLLLLVDVKTEAISTLDALIKTLHRYPALLEENKLRITITGNQPPSTSFEQYPSWIWFDGNIEKKYSSGELNKISLYSANLRRYTNWNGKGVLTKADQDILQQKIEKSRKDNKHIRFWNAPDLTNAWYQLMKLGVGLINTDLITASASFINQLPYNTYYAPFQQAIYQPTYQSDGVNKRPKNIILLIADGMGMAQLQAAYTANRGDLTTFKIKNTGWSLTSSSDSYITDSAPGATALSSGSKTNNRSVGVDATGISLQLLPDILFESGKKTAIITAGDITDATPASFYAHQKERNASLSILADIKNAKFSILMGAGNKQIDSFLLANKKLISQTIVTDSMAGKPAALGRGNWLKRHFKKSVDALKNNPNGFFVMAEGAQVDYGGHQNQLGYVVTEMLDFDDLVGAALEFADSDGETLIIVTADHETGGLTLLDGDVKKGYVSGNFSTTDHTAIPVPVFAYGLRSFLFGGVYENTAIFQKIIDALKQ